MCGLAHYIEESGIPTVIISLVKRHAEVMQPPRALHVPFELGRPFGFPNQPVLQRKVLLEALLLLERNDGPILEDFSDPTAISPPTSKDDEGWTCPVNFPPLDKAINDKQKLSLSIKQEINLLAPWYEQSLKQMNGRRLDGLTDLKKDEIADFLVGWGSDPTTASIIPDENIIRALKLAADDLRHFYYQAAMAKPGVRSDVEIGDWFYGETYAGKLFIKIRELMLASDDEVMKAAGRTNYVPNAMLKHVSDNT